jgi:predicted ferric reductase
MKKIKIGYWLIYLSLLITFILWVLAKNSISEIFSWPLVSINQVSALLGTTLFVWSMFLSTRLDFLENFFGGLDKVYKVHRRVSEIGVALILIHPLFLAMSEAQVGLRYFLPVHSGEGVNLGVIAFWIFAIIILLTLFIRKIKLPYHIWKRTHKFINFAMILVLMHVVMIRSDTLFFAPLGTWMNALVGLGVASGLYMSFFYKYWGPKYKYKILKIKRYGDVHDVYLKPLKEKLPFRIAQFAYVSFEGNKISREVHPFCITSLPENNILRFSIKELGDYTKTLINLRVDDRANVWGAYGMLGKKFESGSEDAIFVGGGIGVAPFLSMFKKAGMELNKRQVSVFYCIKYKDDNTFGFELENIKSDNRNLYYHNQCSRGKGGRHLTTNQILEKVRDIGNTVVYLCGPTKMMSGLRDDLIKVGFSDENIVLENFEMI